ncbi:relaxase/mobilization nuclease domain-containing protein [Butyricicoccus sp. AM27-36]|uniref:relaxase/mobilization nuclease domain-containing protein n=1 Tax=Butyricicoccus sp. AM27-36 TaxID=2292293 RepID=UPI000E53EA47|nr:relaxase/mobilization nuclease domain-containing protein [Butyricicoccus sp. AM27-36]RHT86968.1 hypothetical protein DW724_10460 [Butyricicoccus sp. AM27-36]
MAIVHFVNYKRGTQSRAAMRGVMLYVMQEKKTAWEGEPLVSGINCQPQSVYDDFLNTKLLYHKDGGVMFYHMVQSFPKGAAVDPRQAHEAARRLAEYFEGCEVLVCTHVDREHIHSHCVINSVNFETGKKLHMAKEQLQELMRRNDAICLEMGLPVFEPTTHQARGMSGAEYHVALKGQSWKLRLTNAIDECMRYAADRDAFVSLMASEGCAVRWENGRKYITYTTPDGLKCRDNKLHEEKYCKEAMEHEFRIRAEIVYARTQAAQHPAGSTSDADNASRSESHESGLGANDERSGYTVVPCGSADGSVGEYQQADVAASHTDADGRAAESGEASGADERTGWETEREAFFSARHQATQTAAATPGWSHMGGSADGDGGVASALVGLGHRLEQLQPAEPVIPARHYTDRKALQKEREKKIALGHKADDHEDEVSYDWQQTM